jgi:hypothetical protein
MIMVDGSFFWTKILPHTVDRSGENRQGIPRSRSPEEEIMEDKYTQYPDHLKKRIENVDKMYADEAKVRQFLSTLSEEDKALWDAVTQEERIKWLEKGEKPEMPDQSIVEPPEPSIDQPSPMPETLEGLKAELDKVQQKYKTLQGMSKDTGELERQINSLLTQIKILQDQNYELQQKVTKPVTKEVKKVNVREALKEHYESLGQDLAPDIVEKEIKKDERLFELLEERANQNISEVATKFDKKLEGSAKEQFEKDLRDAYPNWKQMWGTPEFQAFLTEEDGISGYERYEVINSAFQRCDSRVVIRAFDLFTHKGVGKTREPAIDPNKVKNRISAPRSSAAPVPTIDHQNPNQMNPREARQALANLSANYTKGLFKGTKEDYDKEYKRLWNLCQPPSG